MKHMSAQPSHYDEEAHHYDTFNEENSRIINHTITQILTKHNVSSVLDMTCGTGSQVLHLTQQGFTVVGSDINAKMLSIAQEKATQQKLDIQFMQGDMRTLKVGHFDAIITIFNAIGHLTKTDFEQAIKNIRNNLKNGGLYIFDIFNLSYLLASDNITRLTIDWQKRIGDTKIRNIQYSTIDMDGVLASYTLHFEQHGPEKSEASQSAQTLQIYTAQQLKDMLQRNGFQVLDQCDSNGSPFNEVSTERILTIAIKK